MHTANRAEKQTFSVRSSRVITCRLLSHSPAIASRTDGREYFNAHTAAFSPFCSGAAKVEGGFAVIEDEIGRRARRHNADAELNQQGTHPVKSPNAGVLDKKRSNWLVAV